MSINDDRPARPDPAQAGAPRWCRVGGQEPGRPRCSRMAIQPKSLRSIGQRRSPATSRSRPNSPIMPTSSTTRERTASGRGPFGARPGSWRRSTGQPSTYWPSAAALLAPQTHRGARRLCGGRRFPHLCRLRRLPHQGGREAAERLTPGGKLLTCRRPAAAATDLPHAPGRSASGRDRAGRRAGGGKVPARSPPNN
jgi:hypothetical protein